MVTTGMVQRVLQMAICRHSSYSALSVCMGSMEAAGRAGTAEAARASRKIEVAASMRTVGSSGSTRKSIERKKRLANREATIPMPHPGNPNFAMEARTSRITPARQRIQRCKLDKADSELTHGLISLFRDFAVGRFLFDIASDGHPWE
jgi:hypothetical protein